ncbi:MAG: hypothetical protein IPL25_13725 [Saprospiraceae bacterium]|nr:hypothetical protein [Candidatus Vicinibacter affinis]
MNFLIPEFKWEWYSKSLPSLVGKLFRFTARRPSGWTKIWKAIQWTMALQIPAVILIFLWDCGWHFWWCVPNIIVSKRSWTLVSRPLHAFPVFWVGSLLLIFFANPDFFNWFPAIPESAGGSDPFSLWIQQPAFWILPITALVLPSLAVIYNLFRKGLENAFQKRFWMRARAAVFLRWTDSDMS